MRRVLVSLSISISKPAPLTAGGIGDTRLKASVILLVTFHKRFHKAVRVGF